jgi:DNA repair and recombination protein RAD54B
VCIIQYIVHTLGERVVIVSQWTSMLTLVEIALKNMNISFCRLDGATPVSKRQDIVDRFNKNNIGQVFLLSTAAGGAGLNLIGSNRLVLVDSHWNPAYDAQAMARIWRDGQKKDCFVYRLITTGTIEEKIYQRQMLKGELAKFCVDSCEDCGIVSSKDDVLREGSFSRQDLKELFEIQIGTSCMTAEQLQDQGKSYANKMDFSDDMVLHNIKDSCPITFVFDEINTRDTSSSKQTCNTIPDKHNLHEIHSIHDLDVSDEFE